MEKWSSDQKSVILEYYDDPNYPQPHGQIVASQLLAAMIASGKYELEEYPKLVEASIALTNLFIIRVHDQMTGFRSGNDPKPPASEKGSTTNSEADYDPIPF
jgi:hypothetical protein